MRGRRGGRQIGYQSTEDGGRTRLRVRFGSREPDSGRQRQAHARVVLVGQPNVGKSVVFHRLTGVYVTVSNYPGTTVEVARGYLRWADRLIEVVDTPGMYSLIPTTEDETVARRLLLREHTDVIVHVVDAKNLRRMLIMTLELMETGIPLILVVNMMDEAERLGIGVNFDHIRECLGTPVVGTSAVEGTGMDALRDALRGAFASHA